MFKVLLPITLLALTSQVLGHDFCVGQKSGTRLPHPVNCNEFIVCGFNQTLHFADCPEGLHFNRMIRQCDLPEHAGCQMASALAGTCDCNCCATQCLDCDYPDLLMCKNQTDGTVLKDPNNCGGFITCHGGCATPGTCPHGELWNPATEACGPSCALDCPGSGYPCCGNDLTVCKNEPDCTVLPNPDVCGGYVTCESGCAIPDTCPDGQLWDPVTKACGPACAVECPDSGYPCRPVTGPSGEVCSNPGQCLNQKDGTMLPDLNNKHNYIVCQCECELSRPCSPGLIWNNDIASCDYPEDYYLNRCPDSAPVCIQQAEGTLLPIPGQCNKFYLCSHNCAYEYNCPETLYFDNNSKQCVAEPVTC